MSRLRFCLGVVLAMPILVVFLHGCRPPVDGPENEETLLATRYLKNVMDRFHKTYDVYTDMDAAGNHFIVREKLSDSSHQDAVGYMNEAWTDNPYAGINCIRCTFESRYDNWGGWYFMNGVLITNDETVIKPNWGNFPNAGINLSGATKLTFWARGDQGGERVEFFALGVGRDPDTGRPVTLYPDSSRKVSSGTITLSKKWKQYKIRLRGRNLSYVLGGFGWSTNALNNLYRDITFYLDDIRYHLVRVDEPRFLTSYETIYSEYEFDAMMRNVAFTYDNALVLLAFLADDAVDRAGLIADAFVYAISHDQRHDDGRIRNAYQGGDLTHPPGWAPQGKIGAVRQPGWYDMEKEEWSQNSGWLGSHTGNLAWAVIALLAYYEKVGGDKYLDAAETIAAWIEDNCRDNRSDCCTLPDGGCDGNRRGGYIGGVVGRPWDTDELDFKATEHNIDVYAAFERLYVITGKQEWRKRAESARNLVLSMWDTAAEDQLHGKFWTGTGSDGCEINKADVPLDIQAWALLALKDLPNEYHQGLLYAEEHMKLDGGFDFDDDRDGIWYEGTAQMAVAYWFTGQEEKYEQTLRALKTAQAESGALYAASIDELTTGFSWLYYKRAHIAATAWLVFAQKQVNPFWLE